MGARRAVHQRRGATLGDNRANDGRGGAGEATRAGEGTVTAGETVGQGVRRAQQVADEETLPKRVALRRGRGGLVAAVLAFVGFAGIFAAVRANRSADFDLGVTVRLQRWRHPWVAKVMEAASWPGFPPQSRVVPPAIIASMWLLRLRLEAVFQLLSWGSALLSTFVKAKMKRARPEGPDLRVVVAPLGGSSFPSGHTITYVGTYGFLAYLVHTLVRPRAIRRVVVSSLLALVALVGPSRVYQGHHWPTDVSASYLLGFSYLIGLTSLYRRFKERSSR